MIDVKNDKQKISSYESLMAFMEDACKKKGKYRWHASEYKVNDMLAFASPIVFGFSSHPQAEQFTWNIHAKYVFKHRKKNSH